MLSSAMSSKQIDFNFQDCIICTKNEKNQPALLETEGGFVLIIPA